MYQTALQTLSQLRLEILAGSLIELPASLSAYIKEKVLFI